MAIDNPNWDYRLVEQNNNSVTLNYSTSWSNIDTSSTFTTGAAAPIKISYNLIHQYEQGATNCSYRLILLNASDDSANSYSNEMQVSKQGQGANMAYGAHYMNWTFYNVAAGSYKVRSQARNIGNSGTQHITCYFSPNNQLNDHMVITYQA
tara:strand:+ start:50 stop:502 length:453 start_codon:yes stop_codon:yes gene_type:complete